MFTCLLVGLSIGLNAQYSNINISIAGLTCSQCSKSVEMQLKKLKFVTHVNMDLKATTASITTKNQVDFYALAKAVSNAGFSVKNITAMLHLDKMIAQNDQCFLYQDNSFWILKPTTSKLITVQFIGKAFGNSASNKDYSICQASNQYIVMPL